MEINEYKIKLNGVANIPKELELCKSYTLKITDAEVRAIKDVPNDDNTKNRVFTINISEMSEVYISDEKEIIKARKKGSQSQVLKFAMRDKADELGLDREEYYKDQMSKIINKYKQ